MKKPLEGTKKTHNSDSEAFEDDSTNCRKDDHSLSSKSFGKKDCAHIPHLAIALPVMSSRRA
eukprot:6177737-Pleurochrysis_carterae.AAC.1